MRNFKEDIIRKCNLCHNNQYRQFEFAVALPIIALDVSGYLIEINGGFCVTIDNEEHRYVLRGIIYFSNYHFTSRIIYENGMTWFHDGIATGDNLIYDGMIDTISNRYQCRGKNASIAIYTKI
ncbi:hypothetical protein F5887DRAFT_893062 [Amanita rubescens]|nr:hypothetical protein F5887DRAFT_893062 [Amanita rubescens]